MSQTLDRALSILEFLAGGPRRIGEVAELLDCHHSTALRLLQTLKKHQFAYELPNKSYRLGSATFRLGFQALEKLEIRDIARPFMIKLCDQTKETIHLATLESNQIVYTEIIDSSHAIRTHSRIGKIANPHSTGVGKAILTWLPIELRQELLGQNKLTKFTSSTIVSKKALEENLEEGKNRGYLLDLEENEEGIHCIAAPIFGGFGITGALSISVLKVRMDRKELISFHSDLIHATKAISEELGGRKV